MYYLYKLIFTKMSDVPNLQSYIPLNDEILVTSPIDNYVYMEQNLNCISNWYTALLTLYDPGGGFKSPPLRFFALTHLILELHYCALVTFPKK